MIDFSVAFTALVLLLPILIVIGGLVYYLIGNPVLFRQVRPGLNMKPFRVIKFRTMTDERSDDGVLLPDSKRLTRLGRLLRATSLDELPQLVNILRGDMSFVGPRPLLMEYVSQYTERERLRHAVRPGVTGWAQVNGRNNLELRDRYELDVWYVENRTWRLDVQIFWRTIIQVLKGHGARPDGYDGSGPSAGPVKRKRIE